MDTSLEDFKNEILISLASVNAKLSENQALILAMVQRTANVDEAFIRRDKEYGI
jgi:hypothetical protein